MNTGIDDVNDANGKWKMENRMQYNVEIIILCNSKSVKKSFYSRVRVTNSANLVSIMIV